MSPALEQHITETITQMMPSLIAKFFTTGNPAQADQTSRLPSSPSTATEPMGSQETEAPATTSRGDRFFATEELMNLSPELLDLAVKAFTKPLTKERWKVLNDNYPPIKGADIIMRAPTMEAGMKEEIQKSHGARRTKDVFAFDEGLAEQQGPFIQVARPILSALSLLDSSPGDDGEDGPDPESIREMLEDALVMLGNANARLNVWRQRRFAEFLTELGRRTLREGIPTDKHLFPHLFHERIKSEHDHKASNTKLIAKPRDAPKQFGQQSQPFRAFTPFRRGQQQQRGTDRKRKWAPRSGGPTNIKYQRTSTNRASNSASSSASYSANSSS